MGKVTLTPEQIQHLIAEHLGLVYNQKENTIKGVLQFDLIYPDEDGIRLQDQYEIMIDLNSIDYGAIPKIYETEGRIEAIAISKGLKNEDLHLNFDRTLCIVIPPKVKERYPNGFDLVELLKHLQEHFYWITYYDKFNKKPWPDYAHREYGYLQLYIEDKEKYKTEIETYFNTKNRQQLRKKIKELQKKYKK